MGVRPAVPPPDRSAETRPCAASALATATWQALRALAAGRTATSQLAGNQARSHRRPQSSLLDYLPTSPGIAALTARGVAVPIARRDKLVAFSCLDWSKRRWHLGRASGPAAVDAMAEAGCIRRIPGSRVVELTGDPDEFLPLDAPASLR